MIIRAPRPTANFSVFANDVIRDNRLSYKARGILLDLLSRPDNWRISAKGLASMNTEGVDAITAGLKELRQIGYLVTKRSRNEKGQWVVESFVYDSPVEPELVEPELEKPKLGNPAQGNPVIEEESIKKNLERRTDKEELIKNEPKNQSPNGLGVRDLVALYFDNFDKDLIAPSGAVVAGQMQSVLKKVSIEDLEMLVPLIAANGKPVSVAWLNWAKGILNPKPRVSEKDLKVQATLAKFGVEWGTNSATNQVQTITSERLL